MSNHDPYSDFVPSLLVGYRKVYSVRGEADVVMTSATLVINKWRIESLSG